MISVPEAKQIITGHCRVADPVTLQLSVAAGKVLAADIFSKWDIPAFPQSSMDGYAFNYKGFKQYKELTMAGEIAAGDGNGKTLQPNEAVRIFTGAPVPAGADTVVMQEKTMVKNDVLGIADDDVLPGSNVRCRGSEIKEGQLALKAGSLLTAAAIGFLAGIGITDVCVYPSPSVAIIVTGNELQTPGKVLQPGQVYESNSFALKAALSSLGINQTSVKFVKDNLADITSLLDELMAVHNMVILTGGVSVGDYDFVAEAAQNCGVQKLFHRVKQKPGKPLYFGKKDHTLIFGLPGNPSSVLTCFYQYVSLALQGMQNTPLLVKTMLVTLATPLRKTAGLTHFLKGYVEDGEVNVLDGQESYRMHSFAKANCLVEIAEHLTDLNAGDQVNVYLLPGC